MTEFIRLLLVPLLAVAGWLLSRHNTNVARTTARVMSVAAILFLIGIAGSGLSRIYGSGSSIHKWTGHLMAIAMWLFVPFSVGVALERNLPAKKLAAFAWFCLLLAFLAIFLLNLFTGYLGPSHVDAISEETANRFKVLHLFVLPATLGILATAWCWMFRPHTPISAEQTVAVERRNGAFSDG